MNPMNSTVSRVFKTSSGTVNLNICRLGNEGVFVVRKKCMIICIVIGLTVVVLSCRQVVYGQNKARSCEEKLITFWMREGNVQTSGLFNVDREVIFYSKDYYVKTDFSDGYALISENYDPAKDVPVFCSVIDVNGNTILKYRDLIPIYKTHISEQMFQYMISERETKIEEQGFYDIYGNKVIYCDRRVAYFAEGFHEGYVSYVDMKKHKAFFMDKHGTFLKDPFGIPVSADILNSFSEGCAVFGEKHGNPDLHTRSMSLWGIMDKKGRKLLSAKYTYLGEHVKNGFIPASLAYYDSEKEAATIGLIDLSGNWKIEPKYYEVKDYSGNVCAVRYMAKSSDLKERNTFGYRASGWRLVDIDGTAVFTLPEDYLLDGDFNDGYIVYGKPVGERQWKRGIMNERGDYITEPIFDEISYSSCGYWKVVYNGEYMLYSQKDGLVYPKDYLDFSRVR